KINIAITSFYLVHYELIKHGIPTYRISPSKSSIRDTLKQVFSNDQKDNNEDHQFAICLFDISVNDNLKSSSKRKINSSLRLYQKTFEYGKRVQAIIDWSEVNEVRLITTRRELESS